MCSTDWTPSNSRAYVAMIQSAAHRRLVIEYAAEVIDRAYADEDIAAPIAKLVAQTERAPLSCRPEEDPP